MSYPNGTNNIYRSSGFSNYDSYVTSSYFSFSTCNSSSRALRTAMNQEQVQGNKVDHGKCIDRNSNVRPAKRMVEGDCKRWSTCLVTLKVRGVKERGRGRWREMEEGGEDGNEETLILIVNLCL